jgi:hypothetical protein
VKEAEFSDQRGGKIGVGIAWYVKLYNTSRTCEKNDNVSPIHFELALQKAAKAA